MYICTYGQFVYMWTLSLRICIVNLHSGLNGQHSTRFLLINITIGEYGVWEYWRDILVDVFAIKIGNLSSFKSGAKYFHGGGVVGPSLKGTLLDSDTNRSNLKRGVLNCFGHASSSSDGGSWLSFRASLPKPNHRVKTDKISVTIRPVRNRTRQTLYILLGMLPLEWYLTTRAKWNSSSTV